MKINSSHIKIPFMIFMLAFSLLMDAICPKGIWAKSTFQINNNFQGQINGFGTFGITGSDSSMLGFRRELNQKHAVFRDSPRFETDSRLGVQFSLQHNSHLAFNTQFIAKNQSSSRMEDHIQQAFVTASISPAFKIRAGRLPIDAFLLSEYRDVGYAYLWVRPTPEFYAPILMNSFKGFDVSYQHSLGNGVIESRFSAGRFNTRFCLSQNAAPVDVKIKNFWNANIQYKLPDWRLRLGYSKGQFQSISSKLSILMDGSDLMIHSIADLPDMQKQMYDCFNEFYIIGSGFSHISLAAMYESQNWIIQTEIGQLAYERILGLTYTSGYLSVGYRIHNHITPFVVVSRISSSHRTLPTDFFQYLPETTQARIHRSLENFTSIQCEQATLSFGLRWDFFTNTALKLQWNHHWATNKDYLWDDIMQHNKRNRVLNTFSMNIDFLF